MTPAATIDAARDLAIGLESRDRARHGGPRAVVRERVARRVGVAPGTLETLIRRRLKRLEAWVYGRLAEATIADLEGEIRRHETRLALAQRCAGHLAPNKPDEVAALVANLAELRCAVAAYPAGPRIAGRDWPATGERAAG